MEKSKKIVARVLIINTNPTGYDGIMSAILNDFENMDRTDMFIGYVAINEVEQSIKERLKQLDIKVYELPYRTKNTVKYIMNLEKILRKGKYTIAHIHGSSCIMVVEMIAACFSGVPACPHSHNSTCQHKYVHQFLKPLFYLLYKSGFACGKEAGKWLYGDRMYDIVKNGINLDKFRYRIEDRLKWRKFLGLSEKDIGIIHIAHFTEAKNHKFLIKILQNVIYSGKMEKKGYKLFLLGQGEHRKVVEAQVEQCGLKDYVVFVGVTQNVPQYLAACDVLVLPSLYEGFPFAAVEAQASGIRCLISDKVTRDCCFSEKCKYIPLDEEEWVNAILESTNDYDRMEACLENQKLIREGGYDIREIAENLKEQYIKYGKHEKNSEESGKG